jgi:NAD(P)-dependent dehydrogenase (short-subunit alcohol dehydrogenase family)
MDLGLEGAAVIVNGGTAGMGRAAAECFAAEGARVAVSGGCGVAPPKECRPMPLDHPVDRPSPVACAASDLSGRPRRGATSFRVTSRLDA